MTYGPHGVARDDGKVLFLRGVVPGEEVEAEIVEDRGAFAYAAARRILSPSPNRRQPPCPYLPRCGGCPWQHLDLPTQLQAKERNLRDQLERVAGLPDLPIEPILPSPAEFAYRHRLSLRVEAGQVGFYAAASHDLIPIEACLLAAEELRDALPQARDLVRALRSPVRRIEVALAVTPGRIVLAGEVEGGLQDGDEERAARWWQSHAGTVAGVALQGHRWRRVWGEATVVIHPTPEISLLVRAGGFTQVNPEGNQRLVERVLTLAAPRGEETVLDLFAGAGNFTLPLARLAHRVVAVEQSPGAVEDAIANLRREGIRNVEVRQGRVETELRSPRLTSRRFDVVILDPPRSGAREVCEELTRRPVPRLVYVSCNPSTLARDLSILRSVYRIQRVQPIDLFPQTYHSETVVLAVSG